MCQCVKGYVGVNSTSNGVRAVPPPAPRGGARGHGAAAALDGCRSMCAAAEGASGGARGGN